MLKVLIVEIIITTITSIHFYGQSYFEKLSNYKKWSIFLGPALYDKAKLEPQYGTYTFKNKPIPSYVVGIEYDFFPAKRWSFISGGFITLEPIYNIDLNIKKEDLYSNYESDITMSDKFYAMYSFSIPFLVRYRTQATDNLFLNLLTGFKAMYFPNGESYMDIIVHNEDDTESKEVFGLRVNSSDNPFYGSLVVGVGSSYILKNTLLSAKLIYVVNFKNLMEGEYLFDNMFVSPRSYGYYKLSGNHLAIWFSIGLRKKQKIKVYN